MRKLFIVDHDFPPTSEDLAAAATAGATEIICGIPPALADLGITTFGYHEVAPPPAPPPPEVPMWRVRVILAQDGKLDAVDAAVATLPQETQERWKSAPNFVLASPLVQGLVAALGPSLGLDQAAVEDILTRAVALPD